MKCLLVVKNDFGRLLWMTFFPYSIVFYFVGGSFVLSINEMSIESLTMIDGLKITLYLFILISSIIFYLSNILTKEVRIYTDRIEKEWYLFGVSTVYIEQMHISIIKRLATYILRFEKSKQRWYMNILVDIDINLINKQTKEKLLSTLAKVMCVDKKQFSVNNTIKKESNCR